MLNIVLDTEFIPNDLTPTGLISLGLLYYDSKGNRETYYAVNSAMDTRAIHIGDNREWMVENVWKHLPVSGRVYLDTGHPDVKDYGTIRKEVVSFLRRAASGVDSENPSREDVQLVVNCGSQDVVRLHTLVCSNDWGHMPPWVPVAADDVYRLKQKAYRLGLDKVDLPEIDESQAHHALYDAEYELSVFQYIKERFGDI